MSSRKEEKARARAQREAAEQERQALSRRKRLIRLGAIAAVALVAVVVLVIAGLDGDSGDEEGASADEVSGVAASRALLEGIPQRGTLLGDPRAPVVMTEFADLQCPFCREYAAQALPGIVERYVRPGRLRLDLRLLRFIGPDSDRGARAALAAAQERNRLWSFVDLFYRNQGPEGTGYATDAFLARIARAAGVPERAVLDAVRSDAFEDQLLQAEREAKAAGVDSTPAFTVARRGERPRRLQVEALTFEAFERALAPELSR